MLLTLSTTHRPATDLGYLLHKNPAKVQKFEMSFEEAPRQRWSSASRDGNGQGDELPPLWRHP